MLQVSGSMVRCEYLLLTAARPPAFMSIYVGESGELSDPEKGAALKLLTLTLNEFPSITRRSQKRRA
jgi:hypothetical protein